jgi:hypothetical protein
MALQNTPSVDSILHELLGIRNSTRSPQAIKYAQKRKLSLPDTGCVAKMRAWRNPAGFFGEAPAERPIIKAPAARVANRVHQNDTAFLNNA